MEERAAPVISEGAPGDLTDEAEIGRALGLLTRLGDVFEIRAWGCLNGKAIVSGYFKDRPTAVKAAALLSRGGGILAGKRLRPADGVYLTINEINPLLYGRAADRLLPYAEATTADADVRRRCLLFIDCDPNRPRNVSATEEQKKQALVIVRAVMCWLRDTFGFPLPLLADSGNGYHLFYMIDLPNSDAVREIVKWYLEALAHRFDTEAVKIDRAVFNAARIAKLPGTAARKGDHTPEQPHRMGHILHAPPDQTLVAIEQIEAVAATLPEPTPAKSAEHRTTMRDLGAGYVPALAPFDMEGFLARHCIAGKRARYGSDGGAKWQVDCPFDLDHKAPDAAFFLSGNGAPGFKCLHNGCAAKTMRDVAALFGDAETLARFEPQTGKPEAKGERQHPPGAESVSLDRYIQTRQKAPGQRQANPAEAAPEEGTGSDAAEQALFLSVAAFLASVGEPPPMLVEGVLPEKSLILLSGKPKYGKSLLALDLADAVCTGGLVWGTRLVNRPGPVCYIGMEDGKFEIANRLLKRGLRKTDTDHSLHVCTRRFTLGAEKETDALTRLVEPIEPVLLIVDTAREALAVKDYSDAAELSDRLRPLREFARAVCTVLLVAHNRKAAAEDAVDEIAGSNAFASSVDGWISARRKEDLPGGNRRLFLDIDGRGGMRASIAVEMESNTLSFREVEPDQIAGEKAEADGERQRQMVERVKAAIVTRSGGVATVKEVAEATGMGNETTRKLVLAGVKAGVIEPAGEKRSNGGRGKPAPLYRLCELSNYPSHPQPKVDKWINRNETERDADDGPEEP